MISRLSIQNYAIIEQLEIEFSGNLNALTGETGAGKSIIVGALGLILGQRADSSVLLSGQKKCVVEGIFSGEAANEQVKLFLTDNELDAGEELIVRREVAPNGKSRAFINDTPVTLAQLNMLSNLLVDLHQQFDTLSLGNSHFQLEVMDALAGNAGLLKKYRAVFLEMQAARQTWQDLKVQKENFDKELDYHRFQLNELEDLDLKEDELEMLEEELKMLEHAEGIKATLSRCHFQMSEGDEPLLGQMKSLLTDIQHYSSFHPGLPVLSDRLQSSYIELKDISEELELLNDSISSDAARLDFINERISAGYRLLKKHGVATTNELRKIREDLNQKLEAVLHIDDSIAEAEKKFLELHTQAQKLATGLSAGRSKAVTPFEKEVNGLLSQVGMPNARLKIDIKAIELNVNGSDDVEFLFDANKKGQFLPVRKVASGGELSRLMLCIKSLVARSMNLPTLIFDEIDAGISGEAARQVGNIMKELSAARQVICITHQPQIAGKATAHYLVYKAIKNNTITTGVRLLNPDERIVAIAKMLGGEKPTTAAMENAREMIVN